MLGISLLTLVPGELGGTETYSRELTRALVERGELGRKTGRGWYAYDQAGTKTPRPTEEMTSS